MAEQGSVRRIKIMVEASGAAKELKKLADSMGSLNKSVKNISGDLSFFRTAFASAFAFVGVREITRMSDELQSLTARIAVLTGNTEGARNILGQLNDVANETKTDIGSAATAFARLSAATKDLGVSSAAVLQITKTLQNTFRLSGATTTEATNATIQLAQGLASGQLRGQELRSVLEQNVVVGELLSKTLGVTRGQLFKFAEQGRITSGVVFEALSKNMDQINSDAKRLGQTFEQTLTVAFNNLKLKVNDLNQEFNLSGKFAKGIEVITNNLLTLSAVIGALALTQLPALIVSIQAAGLALLASPIGLFVTGLGLIGITLVALYENFESVRKIAINFAKQVLGFFVKLGEGVRSTYLYIVPLLGLVSTFWETVGSFAQKGIDNLNKYEEAARRAAITDAKRRDDLAMSSENAVKRELEALAARKQVNEDTAKRADLLLSLNQLYIQGALSAAEYYDKLEKLDATIAKNKFSQGKEDLLKFNEELNKLQKASITRDFNEGKISLDQFNESIKNSEIKKLKLELDAGKLSAKEFNKELLDLESKFNDNSPLKKGAADYLRSIGDLSEEIAGVITRSFSKLEDFFVDFTKTGKANFADFAQAILDDLNRIIIRSLIIRPLAESIISAGAGGDTYSATPTTRGQINGVQPFASGGVVDSPVFFGYGRGQMGMAGEAGAEAILPLKRTSSGDLGVQASTSPVYVNIQNMTGGEVTTSESTGPDGARTIDILIKNKVSEGLASGSFDKVLKQSYGLNRRGS